MNDSGDGSRDDDGRADGKTIDGAPATGSEGGAPAAAEAETRAEGGGVTAADPGAAQGSGAPGPDAAAPTSAELAPPAAADPPSLHDAQTVPISRRKPAIIAAGVSAGILVLLLAGFGIQGAMLRRDEDQLWSTASTTGTAASWQRYVDWAAEVREGGGMRSLLATELTPIWTHAPLATDNALAALADDAIVREDWPALCRVRVEHPATVADAHALFALRGRLGRGRDAFAAAAAANGMRVNARTAVDQALASVHEEDPCLETGALRIEHVIDASSTDLDHTLPGGARTVRAMLAALPVRERSTALSERVTGELRGMLSGVYGLTLVEDGADDASPPHLVVIVSLALHGHERFLTSSGTELPGLALRAGVRIFVRPAHGELPTAPSFESSADIVLPEELALDFAQASGATGADQVYARMIDELYERATARVRQELGLETWTSPTPARASCNDAEPLPIGRVVRGDTRTLEDVDYGNCSEEYEVANAPSDYDSYDSGDDYEPPRSPEAIYRLVVPERALVALDAVAEDGGSFVVYLRSDCSDAGSEVACGVDSVVSAVLEPGVYYAYVDGTDGSAGRYRLAASLHDPERAPAACASAPILAPASDATGDSTRGSDDMESTCGGVGAHEGVHAIEVSAASRLRCTTTASDFAAVTYVRSECGDPESEATCAMGTSLLRTTVAPGRHVVVVDGAMPGEDGHYTLHCDVAATTGPAVAADACASAGTLPASGPLAVDTFTAHDDLRASCGSSDGPDLVYRVDVAVRSHLHGTSDGATTLYLQRTCGDRSSELACGAGTLDVDLEPGTYWLAVDSSGTTWGARSVTVGLTDLVQACSASSPATIGPSAGTTRGSPRIFGGTCVGTGPEVIEQITLTARSHLTIRSTQSFDGGIYLRRNCSDWHTELACSDMISGHNEQSLIDLTLDAGTYYVFVDGESAEAAGTFTLDIQIGSALEDVH